MTKDTIAEITTLRLRLATLETGIITQLYRAERLRDAVGKLVVFAEGGGNDDAQENELEYARLFEKMVKKLEEFEAETVTT